MDIRIPEEVQNYLKYLKNNVTDDNLIHLEIVVPRFKNLFIARINTTIKYCYTHNFENIIEEL